MAFLFVLHATVQKLRAVCNVTESVSYVDAQHGSIFFFHIAGNGNRRKEVIELIWLEIRNVQAKLVIDKFSK